MKTLKEQLTPEQWEEFVEEVAAQRGNTALAREKIKYANKPYNAIFAIATSFDRNKSKKGRDYWQAIADSLDRKYLED